MKRLITLTILFIAFSQISFAQSTRNIGPAEKKLADSICSSLSKHDISQIKSKEDAVKLYTECITEHTDLLSDVADELKIDMTDMQAMRKLGVNIALDLMKVQCSKFTSLSILMAGTKSNYQNLSNISLGTLKRIDNKGFNYIVINESGNENSFLWLRQFPGSEKFTNGLAANLGKKVTISWKEIEVYLPTAKGYYKVKEITDLNFL